MKVLCNIIMYSLLICFCLYAPAHAFGDESSSNIVENIVYNDSATDNPDDFSSVSGTVTLVEDLFLRIVNEDNSEYDFLLTKNTVLSDTKGFIEANSIKEGDHVTAYYIMPDFMIMIYPPQFEASVLVVKPEKSTENVFVGFFDSNLLSSDNELKLNVNSDTPVFTSKGEVYKGSVENKTLMVYYSFQTLSLPAQTSPNKIVVLENAPKKPFDLANLSNTPLYVNGALIKDASAYLNGDGIIMVPLRLIADALGFELHWDGDLRQVRVGTATIMTIGSNEYTVGRAMPRTLDAAPEIKDGYTYVPVSFLTEIMSISYDTGGGALSFYVANE